MNALRAHVETGRLIVDDPVDLPDGTVLHVIAMNDDEMGPEERAEFLRELDASCAEADAGQLIDAADVLAALRT
jgi:hypothetical protein